MREDRPDLDQSRPREEDRESIWSIPPARRALYFGLFTLYALAAIGFLVWYHVFEQWSGNWAETTLSIIQGIGVNTVGAAGLALLTIEGPNTVMVVGDYLRKKLIEPLEERREKRRRESIRIRLEAEATLGAMRAEARAEARLEVQSAWEAWNERRMAAEASGVAFDEPPPGTSSNGDEK